MDKGKINFLRDILNSFYDQIYLLILYTIEHDSMV